MIIATAGHVDHGKTSLVRSLTGIETDRLEEEKRRGLSINLGYAYKPLAHNGVLGFIDVPGHSRFINTMISGVSGIDMGMLVVAADDGLMPQTLEHLQVLDVLGVKQYLLVLSKIDLVDADRVARVQAEMLERLPAGTPSFAISNTTGEGVEPLLAELEERASKLKTRESAGGFRMSIDRAFQMKGAGLVVTGTVSAGVVKVGDTLQLQPQGEPVRVREIHAQNEPSDSGCVGQRCAINISGGVHRNDIERGDWLAAPDALAPSARFEVKLHLLDAAPFGIKHMSQVKLHLGAKRFEARVALLRSDRTLAPGQQCLAQVMTERPILCSHGDRFLLRDYSETATLGGGLVLEPAGVKADRNSDDRIGYLQALDAATIEDVVQAYVVTADKILAMQHLLQSWNVGPELGELVRPEGVTAVSTDAGECWLTEARWRRCREAVHAALLHFHEENPDEQGVRPALLGKRCASTVDSELFAPALRALIQNHTIVLREGLLSDAHFQPSGGAEVSQEWMKLRECLQSSGRKIPSLSQLQQEQGFSPEVLKDTVFRACKQRLLVKLNEKRVALPETLAEFAALLISLEAQGDDLSVINVRDHSGCGRNLVIEILEYFDEARFTRRAGEQRIIIDKEYPQRLQK